MEDFRLLVEAGDATASVSLASWVENQGFEARPGHAPGTMGAGETLSVTVVGSAALRAFVAIAREWIRAHRTKIAVRLEGGGSFVVEGSTDIDEVVELLREDSAKRDRDE
jgi:hypothetical protein